MRIYFICTRTLISNESSHANPTTHVDIAYRTQQVFIKSRVPRYINSHVLTGNSPCINQAIHVLLTHGFCSLNIHILGRHKNYVIINNVHRNECNLVTLGRRKSLLWNRRFRNPRIIHAFASHYSDTKMNFSKRFFPKFSSDKMTLCKNNDQTCFSDARPLGKSLKFSPFRLGFQHHPRGPADENA